MDMVIPGATVLATNRTIFASDAFRIANFARSAAEHAQALARGNRLP